MKIKRSLSLFLILGFLSIHAQANGQKSSDDDRYKNLELFNKVLHLIETNYYEEVDSKKLIYGGIQGMLSALDPHTSFLPPDVFKEFKSETQGKFGGLGIEVSLEDGVIVVISPIDDTPAMKAGILGGDRILQIDGKNTKGVSLHEAVNLMRGKPGSKIKLTVQRAGHKKPMDFEIVRAVIQVKPVKSAMIEPGFGFIRLSSFQERSAVEIKAALQKLEKNGKLKGLVLDLRSNPGGLLDEAVDVANLFIDEGVIVSTRTRREEGREIRYAKKGVARLDFPMVTLVNGSSASASEIVAGALKDHGRSVIMGERSFGKGSVQTVVELGKDIGVKLTIAQYFTPSGTSIQAKGIEPDIHLANYDPEKLEDAKIDIQWRREKDLKQHLENANGDDEEDGPIAKPKKEDKSKKENLVKKFEPKSDHQVKQAVSYLKAYQLISRTQEASKSDVAKGAND